MQFTKYFFILFIAAGTLFSGCVFNNDSPTVDSQGTVEQNEAVTVSGIAEETKDGYYVGEYVLTHEEIQTYDANYVWGQYRGKKIKVVGTAKEVSVDCEPYTQCREGSFNVLYDILSIKEVE